jgi:predicted MFS family arabinose efflux permease
MLGVLVTSVLTVAGTFTVYTYLAVFIAGAGLSPQALSPVLLGFGRVRSASVRGQRIR